MPTMFVSTPLKDREGVVIGVVSLRIDVNALNELMLSLKLGKTGETYLVNKDGYMITESRFAVRSERDGIGEKEMRIRIEVD